MQPQEEQIAKNRWTVVEIAAALSVSNTTAIEITKDNRVPFEEDRKSVV